MCCANTESQQGLHRAGTVRHLPRPQENKQIRAFPLGRQPAGSGKGGMAASGVCRAHPPAGQPVPFPWDRRAQASLGRSPAALSFPARSHSSKTPWVQHPHAPSALRLPSSEKEGIGEGAMSASPYVLG